MASGDMISVDIDFTSFQGGIKEQTFKGVKIQESCCIRDLKDHLKLSRGITGKILMNERELSNSMTLKELEIVTGTVLEMKSFTPAKQYTHSILVKRMNGTVISLQVHSGTTTGGLKHIIQDKIGMPVEEQVLEYDGMIVQDKKRVVEICVHKKYIVLKTRKDPSKPKETGSQNSTVRMTVSRPQKLADENKLSHSGRQISAISRPTSATRPLKHADEDSVDSPCAKRRRHTHTQEVPPEHADEEKLSHSRETWRQNSTVCRPTSATRPLKHADEDSVDSPSAKRRRHTHTQEIPPEHADEKPSRSRETWRQNSTVCRTTSATRPLKHADEDSADSPCAKRRRHTHTQEVLPEDADEEKLSHSRETWRQNSTVCRLISATRPLKLADLSKLAKLPVTAKWRSLGIQLGMHPYQLDTIQSNCAPYPDSTDRCLTSMFEWWLENSHEPPTYEKLAKALTDIGSRALALKFCTDVDTDGLSPNIKNQTHKQGACSDIQTATDTLYSESELQLVQDKLTTSFRDCFGHKRQTLKMEYYKTRNMGICLEYAQNEKQRATWRATAEEIPAESRNSSQRTKSDAANSSQRTKSDAGNSSQRTKSDAGNSSQRTKSDAGNSSQRTKSDAGNSNPLTRSQCGLADVRIKSA